MEIRQTIGGQMRKIWILYWLIKLMQTLIYTVGLSAASALLAEQQQQQ